MITKTEKKKINKTVFLENTTGILIALFYINTAITLFMSVFYESLMEHNNSWITIGFVILLGLVLGIDILVNVNKQEKCLIKMFECLNKIQANMGNNAFEVLYVNNPQRFEKDLFNALLSVKESIYVKPNGIFGGIKFEEIYDYDKLIKEKIEETYSEMNKIYTLKNPSMHIEEDIIEERSIILSGLLFKDAIKDEFIELYEYEKDDIDKTLKRVKLFDKAEESNVILTVPYINEMNKTMLYKDQMEFVKELGKTTKKYEVPDMAINFYDFDEEDKK